MHRKGACRPWPVGPRAPLSTSAGKETWSSEKNECGEMADLGALRCADVIPLDVALENLHLKQSHYRNEPPPP